EHAPRMDLVDDVARRRAERVHQQLDRVAERDLHLRARAGVRPGEQRLVGRLALREGRHLVALEDLLDEAAVALRDHLLEDRLVEPALLGAGVRLRHHDVDAIGLPAHVLVDPAELHLELLGGGEGERAEDAEAAGLAHRRHHVAAVAEGEDRELDAEGVADAGAHGNSYRGVNLTGMCLMPPMKLERSRRTGPSSSMSGRRRSSSSNMMRISSLARWEPRQKWGPPPPKVMWSFGERPTSKRNGSSNTDSSRFAEMYQMTTLSPSAIAWPAISVSCVAVRRNDMTGVAHRSISSMPVGSSDGSSRSRCRWSGW